MEFFEVFLNKDTIHTLSMNQKIIASLFVTLLGMGTTFVGLIAIQYMMQLTSIIVRGIEKRLEKPVTIDKSPAVKPEVAMVPTNATQVEEDEEALIAILTAAIAASLNTSASQIVIKNIRQTNPAWAAAGRNDQINSRF